MMKKLFLYTGIVALLMFFFTFRSARASGINAEGLGARAITMGGAFIGLADDSSAIYWNPSGLAQLKGGGFAAGVYSMSTKVWDASSVSNLDPDKQDPTKGDIFPRVYPTEPERFKDHKEFWPSCATMPAISAYKSFDDFTLGGGVYALAGAYSKWEDTIKDPVTKANIDASIFSILMLMDFNVSVAKRITDKLSLGVGLDFLYAKLQGNIEKDYRNSNDPRQPDYSFGIDADADGMGLQGTLGFLYKFSPKWSLGAMFRTGAKFNLNGDLSAEQAISGPGGQAVMRLEEKSKYYHEFVYPPSWGVGIAYKPTQTLTLTAGWERTDWTKFKWPFGDLHYEKEGHLLKNTVRDPDWSTADAYRFGLEYKYDKRLTLRGGYFIDESGMPEDAEGLTTPFSGDPIQYVNVGFGYQWDIWNLDLMIGTMWGNTYTGVEHRCYDFAFTFSRQFGGGSEGLPGSRPTDEGKKVTSRESFFYKELVFAPQYLFDGNNWRFRDINPATSVGFEY
ncbi:MAG TPA: outer membrane protein transport protein, partial [Syntrophales bacterium]|nr:outer membrane protein transport protein [Syntrophales bacterium]